MNAERQSLVLGGAPLDVWIAGLAAAHDPAHAALLAPDEVRRADRYLSATVRRRFITGRALLRIILSDYLETPPGALVFDYGPRGKPALGGRWAGAALRFNLAHSADCLVLGITWGRALGVDVEHTRAVLDRDQIAAQFFSPAEVAAYHATPDALKPDAFFTAWTRKEAYLKARGDGLALALDSFDVTLHPTDPARLLRAADDDPARWALHTFTPVPDYLATVCVAVPPSGT